MSDNILRRAQFIYSSVLKRTGDKNLAVKAAQTALSSLQPAPQTPGIRSNVQQNPFGRFGRSAPSLSNAQPNGILSDVKNFGREAFRTLPVTGEIASGVDAAKSFGRGDYLGAAGAAAMAIPFAGSIGKRMGSWKGQYNKMQDQQNLLNRLKADRPLGKPASSGSGFSAERLDQLATTQARPHLIDPDKPKPPFLPDGRGRHINSRNMPTADDFAQGILVGSNGPRKPPPMKTDRTSNFTLKKKKAFDAAFDNARESGKTLTLAEAKSAAPGVPDKKLLGAIDSLEKLIEKTGGTITAAQARKLVPAIAGAAIGGTGILAGQFEGGEY